MVSALVQPWARSQCMVWVPTYKHISVTFLIVSKVSKFSTYNPKVSKFSTPYLKVSKYVLLTYLNWYWDWVWFRYWEWFSHWNRFKDWVWGIDVFDDGNNDMFWYKLCHW